MHCGKPRAVIHLTAAVVDLQGEAAYQAQQVLGHLARPIGVGQRHQGTFSSQAVDSFLQWQFLPSIQIWCPVQPQASEMVFSCERVHPFNLDAAEGDEILSERMGLR